jgi:uncharacterized protein (DUF305 family)
MKTGHSTTGHYGGLALMALLSFASMYVLMYAMVDIFDNVQHSFNQVYMAGLMTAPMVIIELALMRSMYPDKKLNAMLLGASVVALIVFWALIRNQAAISDKQFLRSMIPHHAGAVLMCNEAPIADAEVKQLCRGIISSQQAEIRQMKAKLRELDK